MDGNIIELNIKFNNDIRGNFIRLPMELASDIYSSDIPIQEFYFKINECWLVSWDGFYSSTSKCIEINPILANMLGSLKQNEIVKFSVCRLPNKNTQEPLSEVYVKPCHSDDWEILENNAEFLQNELLNQVKIVSLNNPIICYINNIVSKIIVDKIVPDNNGFGRLDNETLIIVEPKLNENRYINHKNNNNEKRLYKSGTSISIERSLAWNIEHDNPNSLKVFVNRRNFESQFGHIKLINCDPTSMQDVPKNTDYPNLQSKSNKILVKVENITDLKVPKNHICLSKMLWNVLGFKSKNNGYMLQLELFKDDPWVDTFTNIENVNITITSYKVQDEKKLENFIKEIQYLTNNTIINYDTYQFTISLSAEINSIRKEIPYVDINNIKNYQFIHKLINETEPAINLQSIPNPLYCQTNNVISDIVNNLSCPISTSSGSLLCGKSGMGKTVTALKLYYNLLHQTKYRVDYLNCETLVNSLSLEKLKTIIEQQVYLGYIYKPSIWILDNADFIFNQIKSDENAGSAQNKSNLSDKITHYLIDTVETVNQKFNNCIQILIVAQNKDDLNNLLFERHFINKIWTLKPPNKAERLKLFEYFSKKNLLFTDTLLCDDKSITFSDIALETEGYSPLDISNFVIKLYYECKLSDSTTISNQLFQTVLKDFTPSALQNVILQNKHNGMKWDQIGGLTEAKNILLETLEWPTRYSPIFQNCPLRLRSGILLYGYPGCGKTLLASAVASQCGLNFISVKGPEILNKYIGASEQNVRELFERAESVKPCILFFDEFDSIAPKRGHDSTGVTDRVVNQLLTQMDGAVGLEGVYVLAATSRPDLIDPALLRPGRLDKCVICDIPDEMERLDILTKIVKKSGIHLESELDLREVAKLTENYSGADLQALCYNANLKGIHRKLDKQNLRQLQSNAFDDINSNNSTEFHKFLIVNESKPTKNRETVNKFLNNYYISNKKGLDSENMGVDMIAKENGINDDQEEVITREDLLEAFHETKASISPSELNKLCYIYNMFQGKNKREDSNIKIDEGPDKIISDVGTRLSLM